ncbi:MAG TPA: hypothetical protein VJN43_04070 [Bryobacteraceae bacterium]|nr:hypothetical protein [Bryobacteraceae bacterium]
MGLRLVVTCLLFAALPLRSAPCRLFLADQSSWFGVLGFYIDFENDAADGTPCRLADMKLFLGVADGSNWRALVAQPAWQINHLYTMKAVITSASAEMWLDGISAGNSPGAFSGYDQHGLDTNVVQGWANGPSEYVIQQESLVAAASDGSGASVDFTQGPPRSMPLTLLAPGSSKTFSWYPAPGSTLTVTATFRIVTPPDPRSFAPYLDRYGQSRYSIFPGKVQSDADLVAAAAEETRRLDDWGFPGGYDAFGGITKAGWSDHPTGFFHLARHDGMWWLITPSGNPTFYIGLDTAPALNWDRTPVTDRQWEFEYLPPTTAPYSAAWGYDSWYTGDGAADVAFHTVNMIRKYGANWDTTATDLTVRRLKAWGFTALGKWSSDAGNLPILPVLSRSDVPSLVNHPDIFDARVQAQFRSSLAGQISPRTNDPLVVGWSLGNEIDETVSADEIRQVLRSPAGVAAKQALVNEALASTYSNNVQTMAAAWGVSSSSVGDLYASTPAPPDSDIEMLRQFYESSYYKFIYNTVKQIDPNHLYLGFWISPGYWQNDADWRLISANCDAIGYDFYSYTFSNSQLSRLFQETDKPVLLGEFSLPADYGTLRGFGTYGVHADDDAGSGDFYRQWLFEAATNAQCLGVAWFQYRNEPVTGRGPGRGPDLIYGENYAFGMVDVTDRPKYDLVERVRSANLDAPLGRLAIGATPPAVATGGVLNSASYALNAPVAPGSLVAVFGTGLALRTDSAAWLPLPLALAGASLEMGGVPAPLSFASATQVNVQVPWELEGKAETGLHVSRYGVDGSTVTLQLAGVSPGIYSMDGTGRGQGAIVHSDGMLSAADGGKWGGRPAATGETVSIYCTGLGLVTNQPATGAPAPSDPLSRTIAQPAVTIGSATALVTFSGLAPGLVGVYQINVQVPAGIQPGPAVPVNLTISGVPSNTVTMSVE